MPWNAQNFASRHNHGLSPTQSAHAARIANAVLKRSGNEGMSIAVANKNVMHRASGGYTASRPQISREDDAEILSHGRRQGRDVDINLTPTPSIRAPINDIPTRPDASWLPGPIPQDDAAPQRLRMADGGDVGFGGVAPTAATMAPIAQQQTGYFSQMSPEQLQEAAVRLRGSPQGQLAQRVLQQKRIMTAQQPTQPQQSAAPGDQPLPLPGASGLPQAYALGGTLEQKGGVHMSERGIPAGGFLHTAGPGRTDNLNIKPHADSYVLPADVVSGIGEGNSLAGAKALEGAFHTAPYGVPMPSGSHVGHRMGPPRPPRGGGFGHAGGGEVQRVPIVAAGGEFVVTPEQCRALGHGDIKRGHEILDAFCLHVRKRTIGEMRKLRGPVKS